MFTLCYPYSKMVQ